MSTTAPNQHEPLTLTWDDPDEPGGPGDLGIWVAAHPANSPAGVIGHNLYYSIVDPDGELPSSLIGWEASASLTLDEYAEDCDSITLDEAVLPSREEAELFCIEHAQKNQPGPHWEIVYPAELEGLRNYIEEQRQRWAVMQADQAAAPTPKRRGRPPKQQPAH